MSPISLPDLSTKRDPLPESINLRKDNRFGFGWWVAIHIPTGFKVCAKRRADAVRFCLRMAEGTIPLPPFATIEYIHPQYLPPGSNGENKKGVHLPGFFRLTHKQFSAVHAEHPDRDQATTLFLNKCRSASL